MRENQKSYKKIIKNTKLYENLTIKNTKLYKI